METRERHRFLQHDPERPILPPEDLFLKPEDFFTLANNHAQLAIRGTEPTEWARPLPDLSVERGGQDPLRKLEQYLARTGNRTLVVAESPGRRESLLELLRDHRIELPSIDSLQAFADSDHASAIVVAPLAGGFIWQEAGTDTPGLQFITETELFDAAPTTRRRRKADQATDVDSLIKDLSELNVGDPVVHSNHGIGRYQGLINLDLGDGPSEFLHLEYADKATLYVPVSQLHLISRYTGVSADEALTPV